MAPTTRSSKRHATEGPLGAPVPSQLVTASNITNYTESSTGRPDTPESSEAESDPKPTPKRVRGIQNKKNGSIPVKAPKQGRVKGKLEVFKNVPVEVFIEIAKYLHPFDLVLLSRVNKFFRELFMSRQAASIWVSARQSVPDLPPCPLELCEPQYAALLFTKMCSQCGKYAPRHMDPVLLVRLCSACLEAQYQLGLTLTAKLPDSTLVARSLRPTPRHLRQYGYLRLGSEIETVYSKLQELTAVGDQEAILRWKNERRAAVQDRYTSAQVFIKWFETRDSERENDLNRRRDNHEAEVGARLINLGWEPKDHLPYLDGRRKQWLSLVRTAKILTDRTWDKLYPQLLAHLKANKEERLERERDARKKDRHEELHNFWFTTKDQLPPLLQGTPRKDNLEIASLSTTVPEKNSLYQAFPPLSAARKWPEWIQLLEEDITRAELRLKLPGMQDSLNEYVQKWRVQLEQTLIQQLPHLADPPEFRTPYLTLTSDVLPAEGLSAVTNILLRADVVFTKNVYSKYNFYPENFQEFQEHSSVSYDADSSATAADLLRELGRPRATYLEIKSLGNVFRCGRCIGSAEVMSWASLIGHYTTQKSIWENQSKGLASLETKEYTYLFTHDMKVQKPNKRLFWIVKEGEIPPVPAYSSFVNGPRRICLVCRRAGIYDSLWDIYIKEHLSEAHLIEDSEEGKHFR